MNEQKQQLFYNAPMVTVLVAMYNAERYIADAIRSVLDQTYHDFEILIINDGSTDSSLNIAKSFSEPSIRIINQENTGVVLTRKTGVAESRGKYIAILDSDDISLPDRLEKQIDFLESNVNVAALGGEAIYISAPGEVIGRSKNFRPMETYAEKLASKEIGFIHSSFMFRRSAILSVGNYDEHYLQSEDLDLVLKLSEKYTIAMLSDVLVKFRRHSASYSHTPSEALKVQWYYGALASVNHFRRKEGLKDLFSEEEGETLAEFKKHFSKSEYHRTRLARQQINFGTLDIKDRKYFEALRRYYKAFTVNPRWFLGSQKDMLKKLIKDFI